MTQQQDSEAVAATPLPKIDNTIAAETIAAGKKEDNPEVGSKLIIGK